MAPEPDTADGPGYAEALQQLETILADLEREGVDVDVLAAKVRSAAELIRYCRGRITNARMEVDQIVADFDDLG